MQETSGDIEALQQLLDCSYAAAGEHLKGIITPARRVSAPDLAGRLTGMTLLALATVTADGRPLVGPVDGVFYRAAFHFGTSPGSVRWRHVRSRPWVSATHLPGESFAVTVHGRAIPVDVRAAEGAGLRAALEEIYAPRVGADAYARFLEGEDDPAGAPVFARIDAQRMFTLSMAAGET